MSPTIICGIDDSTHARAAARLTFALAERLSLRPVLVHAVSGAVPPLMPVMPHRVPLERGELVLAAREAGERLRDTEPSRAAGPHARRGDRDGRHAAGRSRPRVPDRRGARPARSAAQASTPGGSRRTGALPLVVLVVALVVIALIVLL